MLPRSRPRSHSFLVWVALWIVYVVWGSTYLAIRVTVETLPPLMSAGVRFLVAGAVVYAVLRIRRGPEGVRVTRRELVASAAVGTALLLGGNGLVMVAEQSVPSALAALIIASVPLWVVVLRTLTGERVDRGTLAGVAVGFVGVAILVMPGGTDGARLAGMLTLIAASFFWASGSFYSRRLSLPADPFLSTAVQQLAGGVVVMAFGLGTGELSGLEMSEVSLASALGLAYLIVFGSLLAFTAYTWVLQNAPISQVATYAYVNPVVAIFLGWLILSEEITATILVGAAVIVASVAFIVRKEAAPPTAEGPAEPIPEAASGPPPVVLEPSRF
jgi:drug/metabolite transporter (DMT)-like permease